MSVVASSVEPFSKYSVRWLVTLKGAVSHVPSGRRMAKEKAECKQEGRTDGGSEALGCRAQRIIVWGESTAGQSREGHGRAPLSEWIRSA
jgi:hypothetical protein